VKIKQIEIKIFTEEGFTMSSNWLHPKYRPLHNPLSMFKEPEKNPYKWFRDMIKRHPFHK
jgi:hypothetical protein